MKIEQFTLEQTDIPVTHFRDNLKKFLKVAQEEGVVTIKQGNVRFHVVPTKNCTENKIRFLYY